MRFEWDFKKAKSNYAKHGVAFEEAVTVFLDSLAATFDDTEHSYEEQRFITVGYTSNRRLLFVSHSERGDAIRIISARESTPRERKRHESHPKDSR